MNLKKLNKIKDTNKRLEAKLDNLSNEDTFNYCQNLAMFYWIMAAIILIPAAYLGHKEVVYISLTLGGIFILIGFVLYIHGNIQIRKRYFK